MADLPPDTLPLGFNVSMGNFGGYLWTSAEREGRIKPGPGPYFTRRVYPSRTPRLRRDVLADGVPRRTAAKWESPNRSILLPPAVQSATSLPEGHRLGPDGWSGDAPSPYQWDILTRLRAHWLLAQDCVGAGWCALASHGLPYWADSERVVLLSRTLRHNSTTPYGATFRELTPNTPTVAVDPAFPDLRVVDVATAAAQCLATIHAGKKTWWVPTVPDMMDREVRSVQLIDALYQCSYLTAVGLEEAAHHIVDRNRVERLLTCCDTGAQSPMETIMRLIVRDELPTGHDWTSQVTISLDNGTVVDGQSFHTNRTTPDLACTTLKVALFYDGRHHRTESQMETDFRLYQRLKVLGWEAVRINKDLLRDLDEMLEQVRYAIRLGQRWLDG